MGSIKPKIGAGLIVLGILLFILGTVVKYVIFPSILESEIYKNLKLSPNTEAYDAFVEPPVPVYMKFRFFNVSNPESIKNGDIPILTEVGPYAYRYVTNIIE